MPEGPCEGSAEALSAFPSTSIKEIQGLRGVVGPGEAPN